MKYLIPLLLLILTSCGSPQEYDDITNQFSEVKYTNANAIYSNEKKELKPGDKIILTDGTNNFLKQHFGSDSCSAQVKSIFFSKPTGKIAFLTIKENKSQFVTFSISLYFWDNVRGYNVSTLEAWERELTDKELDILNKDFTTTVDHYRVDNNISFKITN